MKKRQLIETIALFRNIGLNLILMQFLAHGGLALASSISSFLNFALLMIWARKGRTVGIERSDLRAFGKAALAAIGMALSCVVLLHLIGYDFDASFTQRLLQLVIILVGSVAAFVGLSKLLRCEELGLFISSFRRKRGVN